MINKLGVIDLGSNTFHLLIIEKGDDGEYHSVLKKRSFVGLAEKGIENLSSAAMERGLIALLDFKSILQEHQVVHYSILGTSALRSAKNSLLFLNRVKSELDFDIEVIDGNREAELIYKGVRQLIEPNEECHVIIDVGGGSVEFIAVEKSELVWAKSYDLGVGVLYNHKEMSDPCTALDVETISEYIDKSLVSLKSFVSEKSIDALIGASGSFEVVQSMNGDAIAPHMMSEIKLEDYHLISQQIISSTMEERLSTDGLPESRVKLIVVAMILIDKAIEIIKPRRLLVSPYALKEGVISELRENDLPNN